MLEGLTPPQNKAVYCKIQQIQATLDQADLAILNKALDDTASWGARTLSTALRNRGLSVADTTITKHRQQACACFRK